MQREKNYTKLTVQKAALVSQVQQGFHQQADCHLIACNKLSLK